jgi:hypothetical protein
MILFFVSCMSKKINQMDIVIDSLQTQNLILQAQIMDIETRVIEMEKPVKEMKLAYDERSTSSASSSGFQNADVVLKMEPKMPEIIEAEMKGSYITKFLISKTQIEQMDHLLDLHLQELHKLVRFIPHRSSDEATYEFIDGYRMTGIAKGTLIHQLGLKNGDILVAVNGKFVPQLSESRVKDTWRVAKETGEFTFLIVRRKQYRIFYYGLDK